MRLPEEKKPEDLNQITKASEYVMSPSLFVHNAWVQCGLEYGIILGCSELH